MISQLQYYIIESVLLGEKYINLLNTQDKQKFTS